MKRNSVPIPRSDGPVIISPERSDWKVFMQEWGIEKIILAMAALLGAVVSLLKGWTVYVKTKWGSHADQNTAWERIVSTLQRDVETLKTQGLDHQEQINTLGDELNQIKRDKNLVQIELDSARAERDEYAREVSRLEKRLRDAEDKWQISEAEKVRMAMDLEKYKAKVRELELYILDRGSTFDNKDEEK